MPTPAKKAATPKRAAKKATVKQVEPDGTQHDAPATPEVYPVPPQVKGGDLILDLSPDMQNQADTHYRNQGKAGGYLHGTDAEGRAIYKAID